MTIIIILVIAFFLLGGKINTKSDNSTKLEETDNGTQIKTQSGLTASVEPTFVAQDSKDLKGSESTKAQLTNKLTKAK